jgi:hypothetical protein
VPIPGGLVPPPLPQPERATSHLAAGTRTRIPVQGTCADSHEPTSRPYGSEGRGFESLRARQAWMSTRPVTGAERGGPRPWRSPRRPFAAERPSRAIDRAWGCATAGAPRRATRMERPPCRLRRPAQDPSGALPRAWAEERLVANATAGSSPASASASASARPHAMPVWGVWLSETERFWFSCSPKGPQGSDHPREPAVRRDRRRHGGVRLRRGSLPLRRRRDADASMVPSPLSSRRTGTIPPCTPR